MCVLYVEPYLCEGGHLYTWICERRYLCMFVWLCGWEHGRCKYVSVSCVHMCIEVGVYKRRIFVSLVLHWGTFALLPWQRLAVTEFIFGCHNWQGSVPLIRNR